MQLYGLKTCDTCRKAAKALPNAQFVDVRADGVPAAVIERALAEFGDDFVNRRSATWRGLDQETREMPVRDLLRAHPALMKRPLIVDGERMIIGWDKNAQAVWAARG